MAPPPEQVSHDSQPLICSMLLIVVPLGTDGAGEGTGVVDEVVAPPAGAPDVPLAAGAGVVAGAAEEAVGTLEKLEEAPQPLIRARETASTLTLTSRRGTERISQF